jgi:hypothetical protein
MDELAISKKLAAEIMAYLAKQPCQEVYAMYTELGSLLIKAEQKKKTEIISPDIKEK